MGNTTCEIPNAVNALRMDNLGFEIFLLCDVTGNGTYQWLTGFISNNRGVDTDINQLAVFCQHFFFEPFDLKVIFKNVMQ